MTKTATHRATGGPFRFTGALLAACAIGGCGDEVVPVGPPVPPTGPVTRAEIVGDYEAVVMTFIAGSDTTDVLTAGGSLTLMLEESAQSNGRLSAPGQGPAGSDIDEDMVGAWTYDVVTRTVRLTQQASTFVGAAVFRPGRTVDGFGLELIASVPADQFIGNPVVEVVLLRADPVP